MLERWNSNGHNFSHGGPIQAHHLSRRSILNNGSSREIKMVNTFHTDVRFRCIIYRDIGYWTMETPEKLKLSLLFTRMSDSGTSHIETLEIEQQTLSRNSNGHNFSHESLIQEHNISRRSTLNNGSSRGNQMLVTFLSDVWFRRIMSRDAWNWTPEDRDKFKLS